VTAGNTPTMRAIGTTDSEPRARTICDYLYARGIDCHIERGPQGGWTLYVHSEEQVEEAHRELDRFLLNPDDPAYSTARTNAEARRRDAERQAAEYQRNQVSLSKRWSMAGGVAPLTIALIAISGAVALFTGLGTNYPLVDRLFIASAESEGRAWLPDVFRGEVWRLYSPLFLHFGVLHLIFNMFWLWDLGVMIERRQSTLALAALVLVIGLVSNVANYSWYGPASGGMSGVVYGLFGYVWIRGRYDPSSGLFVTPNNITIMLVWLVLCMTGAMGPIGNVAHATGLAVGVAWGFISARMVRKPAA